MNNKTQPDRKVLDILKDYQREEDIVMSADPRVVILRDILNNLLSREDRTIILLYLEHQSYRKVAKRLRKSHSTVRSEVIRILTLMRALYQTKSANL